MSIREKFDDAYTIFKNLNHKLTGDINSKNDVYTQYGKMRQYVLDTIIDPEKTAQKFGEHESIESVLQYALNGQLDLLEVANDEFVPRYYAIPEEATPEQIEQINQYNAQVDENILNVHNRIREVVARLKEIGFIDTATKKLLLSVAPRLSAQALFNDDTLLETINGETVATSVAKQIQNLLQHKALSINFVDSTLSFDPDGEFAFNQETVGEAFKEIQQLLADDSKFKNFDVDYDELTVQISQILHKHLNDQGEPNFLGLETHPNRVSVVAQNGTYIRNEAEEDVFDVSKTWYGTKVAELMQGIKQVIERSTQYQLFQELKSELGQVQNSPLYDFLQKLSVSINGANSSVIDLLQKQELDLENGDINDFQIDSVVASEIDSALNLVDIAKSLVNAADTQEFSAFNVYGHNAVINDFSTKMGLPTEYGTISQENAYFIRQDLQTIVDKLNLIKQISALNEANSFKEQERTGKNTTKILTQVLKCNGKYTALKDIEVQGVSLFGGVESISTEHTDQNTKDLSDEVYVEHAKVVMTVYNNYQKILQQAYANGLSEKEVAAELITKLRSAFQSMALQKQETSELNSFIDSMTDSDVMTYIITSCSIDPVTWNEQLKALIGSKTTKFVPLYPQELTALIGSALVKNGTLFQEYIASIVENYEGKDSVPNALYNWLMCSGVGGAGKTSVVGKIIYEVCKSIDPEIKTWNVGPTVTQIENLNKTLPANESMDINSLMSKILDPGEHEQLVKAMSDKNMDSRYSSKSEEGHLNVKLPEDIKFSDAQGPAVIFLDECTYVNSIYAKIISEWARQKGVTVIGLGDSKQSGFYDEKMNLFNVSRASAISMRTPELNISMRASNIQKKANNNKLSTIMSVVNAMAYGDADKQSAYEKLLGDFSLRYFIDEDKQVKGDYVTDSIIKEKIQAMLNGCKSLIYIYDNPNSPTYSIISQLKTENPEVSIELHTIDEVQGKEAEQVIVDLDFNKYSTNNFSNMRTINTALTRALEGTTIIDNGFSKLFPEFKNIKDTYTTNTPDPEKIVESYKESKLNIIDRILNEVSPAEKAELPEPNTAQSSEEEEEEKPEKSQKKVSKRQKAINTGEEVIQPAAESENESPKEETSEESSEEPNEEESQGGNKEGQNVSEKEKLQKKLEKVRSFVKDTFSIDEEQEAFGSNGMIPKPMIETLVSTFEKALQDDSLETSGITEQGLKDLIDDLNNGVIDDWIQLTNLIVNIMYDNSKRPMSDKARQILINELENDDNLPDDEKLYPDFDSYVKGILIEELKNGNINTLEEFDAALSSDQLISSEDQKRMQETINNLRDEYAANGDTMQDNEKYILRKIIQKYENHGYQSSTELESDIEKLRVLREPEDVPHILTDEDIDLIAEISDSVSEDGGSAPSIEPSYNFAKGVRTLGSYKETGINVENGIVKYTEIPGVKSDLQIWLTNNFDITTEKGEDRYNKITSLHNVAKKMLLHYPDQPQVALQCMQAELGLEYEDTYKQAFINGTYKVISQIDPRNNSRKMAKLVYSYNVNGNENIITLSELSNPDTWLAYLTDTLGLDKAKLLDIFNV